MNNKWLFIEPYVYIKKLKSSYLLYNTLNGKYILGSKKKCFALLRKMNQYVIKISEKDQNEKDIKVLVNKIKKYFFGDIIDSEKSPIIFPPKVNKNFLIREERREVYKEHLKGYELKKNFLECSIYINSSCSQDCEYCEEGYKQILFCTKNNFKEFELTISDIQYILDAFGDAPHKIINIMGGNILLYNDFNSFTALLSKLNAQKVFHIQYKNIISRTEKINILKGIGIVNILVNSNFDCSILSAVCSLMTSSGIDYRVSFIITKNNDIECATQFITGNNIAEYSFCPVYNGKNISFFKKNIFVNQSSIFHSSLSIKDIWSRSEINQLNYGKLTVFYDKTIYSNLNFKNMGVIYSKSINEIISHELHNTKSSWRLTRKNVNPCKTCIYHELCPPISNYEYIFQKYNLCNIDSAKSH